MDSKDAPPSYGVPPGGNPGGNPGYFPPPEHTNSPQQGYAPPPERSGSGMGAPQGAYVSPPQSYMPPGAAPPQAMHGQDPSAGSGYVSPQQPPPQAYMAPQHTGMMPQQGMMSPQQTGMSPQQTGMMPQQQGMMPQQQGMMPQQQGMMPQQQGMMPQQGYMSPGQQQPMYAPQPAYGGGYASAVRPQQLTQFPMPVICPNCGQTHTSRTEYVPGTTTHLWAIILGVLTCCCCIPYLVDGLKDVHHYCSNCNIPLAVWNRSGGGTQVLAHERTPGQMPMQAGMAAPAPMGAQYTGQMSPQGQPGMPMQGMGMQPMGTPQQGGTPMDGTGKAGY